MDVLSDNSQLTPCPCIPAQGGMASKIEHGIMTTSLEPNMGDSTMPHPQAIHLARRSAHRFRRRESFDVWDSTRE